MSGKILALDYGTTALKAALYDEHFTRLGVASREWTYIYPQNGHIEYPAELYWEKTLSAVNELFDRFGGRSSLEVVSVTGQSETLIALDQNGEAIGNAIVWLDTRAQEECERFSADYPVSRLYASTGNTGFDPVMPVLKLAWMQKHEPNRYAQTHTFLLLKEYIIFKLSGKELGEYSAQSCSGYFDIRKGIWDREILDFAHIDSEKLPELYDSQHVVGALCDDARRAMGVTGDAQVVNGLLDQCASLIGAGVIDGTQITETTGTVLAIGATLSEFDGSTPDMLVLRHGLKNKFLALPNCSTAGVLLKWFRDEFMPNGADYDAINAEIAARGRAESGLLLLPHFAGYLSPVNNPLARGVLYGLSLDTKRCDVAQAIMEGIGFLLRENLELLRKHGISSQRIISLGGGARSPIWLGIKANICKSPMLTLADEESTALGCAINANLALGKIREEDIPKYIRTGAEFQPSKEGVDIYERKYQSYRELNARLGFNPPTVVIAP